MVYTENARKIALNFFNEIDQINEKMKSLDVEFRNQKITARVRDETAQALDNNRRDLQRRTHAEFDKLKNEYEMVVSAWGALDGGAIHDDAKLLSETFGLNAEELTILSQKHKTNCTMQRAISNYAIKHNILFQLATPLPEQKIKAFENLCGQLKGMCKHEVNPFEKIFVTDPEEFKRLTGAALTDHGEIQKKEPEVPEGQRKLLELQEQIDRYRKKHFKAV